MTATEQEPGTANGINHNGTSSFEDEPLIPNSDIGLQALCAHVHAGVTRFLRQNAETELLRDVQEKTREALGVMEQAFKKYSLSQMSLSYNGGKDCLVLLVLYLHALYEHHIRCINLDPSTTPAQRSDSDLHLRSIQSVYIKSPHPFEEVETFVKYSEQTYSLALQRYLTPMKTAFASYLAENPCVKAIFVGTRRTDPHGSALTHFDMTDRGWPEFMRIHPVIDWHYVEIWSFIKHLNVPYCQLYDMGYTSLGGTNDTMPNPALRLSSSTSGAPMFKPAHELISDDEERLGREFGEASDKKHLF